VVHIAFDMHLHVAREIEASLDGRVDECDLLQVDYWVRRLPW
jgi:hypothetical protein